MIPDDLNEIKKQTPEDLERAVKNAQELVATGYKAAFAKIGRERAVAERDGLFAMLPQHNRIMGSQVRISIPTIDAMLLCLSSIPVRAGLEIMSKPGFKDFVELLYAIRVLMIEERDEAIRSRTIL